MFNNDYLLKIILFFYSIPYCLSLNNGLGLTPQMGWNSWNHYKCNINENLIKKTADYLVSTKLKDFGYIYLNMDDCWAWKRDSNGFILPDPRTFPSGIKALADYVHTKGLKFGIYSDAGYLTCAGRPGSLHHEVKDALTYAEWGVDYLKYDNCFSGFEKPEVRYPIMRDALNSTKRKIFYSLCEWGVDNPATWASSVGNSWRTTGDIEDNWKSMISRIDLNNEWATYAGPGGWNDPDMLEVGNGGMTVTEYKSHFSLWALSKAPLLIGTDITNMTKETFEILTNHEIIAINQDPLGVQGKRVSRISVDNEYLEVWSGPLSNGSIAVILFNRTSKSNKIEVKWSDIGINEKITCKVRDLWAHKDLGNFLGSFSSEVESHGVIMVTITPIKSL
jgi:alpha-galactosidase